MPFVHSLCKYSKARKTGWFAPAELGESTPHYVSFVIPVDKNGSFFPVYSCEGVKTEKLSKVLLSHELRKVGPDSFLLRLMDHEIWFAVKPVMEKESHLPYGGRLKHSDFSLLFTEIEPSEPDELDRLYDDQGIFIIGCEPFKHYSGIKTHA